MHHELLLMALERNGEGGAGVGGDSFPSFSTHVFFYNRKVQGTDSPLTLGPRQLHFYNKEQKHLPLLHPQAFNLLVSLGIFKLVQSTAATY
jgi:hypothetical protein